MLNGKVVLITGASGGLGTVVTRAFLDAGARVAGVARHIARTDFDSPCFEAVATSISSRVQAEAIVRLVRAKWESVDALVHLVGGFTGGEMLPDTTDGAFDTMFDLNVRPFVHMAQAVLPGMREQGSGAILAIGSRLAVDPAEGVAAYAASKAALVSVVRSVALENRDAGLRANAILPETMDTPANRAAMPDADFSKWVRTEQVAALLVHLASDAASQITGAVIPAYGGSL